MKRIVSCLLLIILCMTCVSAQTEGAAELICQNVPWFSTPEETSAILLEAGFIKKGFGKEQMDQVFTGNWSKKQKKAYASSSIGLDSKDTKCPYTLTSKSNPALTNKLRLITIRSKLPKTIAKQTIASFRLYFTPDEENPQLVQCRITFKLNPDLNAIQDALEKAYGKPTATKKRVKIWLGPNNTIVLFNSYRGKPDVIFATLDGLALAESYDVEIKEAAEEIEDTGF